MEVVSPTLYVTVQLVEHSLILHLMLTVVLVKSLVHLPHWVHLVEEQPTTSGCQLCHLVDEDHTVTGDIISHTMVYFTLIEHVHCSSEAIIYSSCKSVYK